MAGRWPSHGRAPDATLGLRRRLEAVLELASARWRSAQRHRYLRLWAWRFSRPLVGLSILLACSSSPPASGFAPALGAAVSSLGTCGTKRFLAALEQTPPLPRLSCPLTGSRLAASLMWAQGSCELPTAKPRTRSLWLRSEAPYLPTPTTYPNYDHSGWIPSHEAGCQSTANHR